MTKKVRTLLAVTLATAAPTITMAGPEHAHHRHAPAKAAPAKVPAPKPVAAKAAPAPAKTPITAMKPRQLPNGAPACGNVQSKMSPQQAEARERCLRGEGK